MDMKPQPEDTTIKLPMTFDYNGGRADNTIARVLATIFLVGGAILFCILMIFRSNMSFIAKLSYDIGCIVIVSLILRFIVFRETMYSNAYETLKEYNFALPVSTIWGIYEIDDVYPYIVRFNNGTKGIYVLFEKDVIVGKADTIMYDHYEAISEAYKLAGGMNMNIAYIDYMDNVGNDKRLAKLFGSLTDCENEDMKTLLFSIYSNLQREMSLSYACYDVYLFSARCKDDTLVYNVNQIIDKMKKGNYITHRILPSSSIRELVKSTLNLEEFSIIDACNSAFTGSVYRGIKPISLTKRDGTVSKLAKTQAEERQERLDALAKERAEKEARKKMPLKDKLKKKKNINITHDLNKGSSSNVKKKLGENEKVANIQEREKTLKDKDALRKAGKPTQTAQSNLDDDFNDLL